MIKAIGTLSSFSRRAAFLKICHCSGLILYTFQSFSVRLSTGYLVMPPAGKKPAPNPQYQSDIAALRNNYGFRGFFCPSNLDGQSNGYPYGWGVSAILAWPRAVDL